MTLGLWNCWSCLSLFFFSSRRRHTRWNCDWSSDVCSSDLLPNSATEQELGKPVGSDLRQGTITLPVILMRDGDLADGRFREAFDGEDVDLQIRLVQESGALGLAHAEAEALVADARKALETLPEGVEREALDALAAYVTQRRL